MAQRVQTCLFVILVAITTYLWPAVNSHSARAEATPVPDGVRPAEVCADSSYQHYDEVQEFPIGWGSWMVQPKENVGTRILYMVTITLKPGECIPYESGANQKDGAVILIVHEGNITYVAEPYSTAAGATVEHGTLDQFSAGISTAVTFGEEIALQPDEWISQDARVWFTYWNTSNTREAVIWKVVWAPPSEQEGCGGDCK